MVDLDAKIIPPIILTQMGKQVYSAVAMERLLTQWDNFYETYYPLEMKYGVNIIDKMWKSDLSEAKSQIASAEIAVNTHMLRQAANQLLKAENIFHEIRGRHGVSYILDDMLDFSDNIREIKKKCAQEKINERDFVQLRKMFDETENKWKKVENTKIDQALFGFTPGKIKALKIKIKGEKKYLQALSGAIYAGNKEEATLASIAIEQNLVQIIRAFGDFNPIIEKVKQENKRNLKK